MARTSRLKHPRSLDALFPRVRVRRCPRGHTQTPDWRASQGCSTCDKADAAFDRLQREIEERERADQARPVPLLPASFQMVCGDGKVLKFSIPKHLQRKPGSRRARRRI